MDFFQARLYKFNEKYLRPILEKDPFTQAVALYDLSAQLAIQ